VGDCVVALDGLPMAERGSVDMALLKNQPRHECGHSGFLVVSIDGMFWERRIFATLKAAAPFSTDATFTSDEYYPANLLTPLLRRGCDNCSRVAHGMVASSRYGKVASVNLVDLCKSMASCYLVKGFHGAELEARRYAVSGLARQDWERLSRIKPKSAVK